MVRAWPACFELTPENKRLLARCEELQALIDRRNEMWPISFYRPTMEYPDASIAFAAASALIFEGEDQPSGYTEPLLHRYRLELKAGRSSE